LLNYDSVVVGRNPSLHPGDLRLLKPTDVKTLHHLEDVVVFSALGPRPACDEMSGGDLDGDIYFVIWDPKLIPATDFPPARYATPAISDVPSTIGAFDVDGLDDIIFSVFGSLSDRPKAKVYGIFGAIIYHIFFLIYMLLRLLFMCRKYHRSGHR